MPKKITKSQDFEDKQFEMLLKQAIFVHNNTEQGKAYTITLIEKTIENLSVEEMAKLLKINPAELEKDESIDEWAEIIFNHKMKKL